MKVCGQEGRMRVARRSRIAAAIERNGLSLAAAGVLFGAAVAPAATWVGNSSADFNLNTNWQGNTLPAATDTLVFNAAGTAGLTLNDNLMTPGTHTVSSITFNASAGAYTINSATPGTNGFTLTGNITNSSTNLQTINDAIVTTAQRTVTMTAGGGNVTLGGNISGTGGGVLLAGSGTLTLSGNNSFTGNSITVNGDTIQVGVRVANGTTLAIGSNTALGASTAFLDLGPGTGTIMAVGGARTVANGLYTLNANGTIAGSNDLTFNGALVWGGSNTIFVNNTGLTTFAGGMTIRQSTGGARTVILAGTGNILINSVIANGTATGSLTYAGTGTLTLAPGSSNTYTGATLISSGTVQLDYSQTALTTNIIGSTSALQLGGGTLAIKGDTGETDAQTFASTTFNTGTASSITVNQNGAAAVNLTLNGFTRNAGSTVNFVLPTTGAVTSTTTTSSGTNKVNGNGIAYSTVNSNTWLVNNGGALSALTTYNTDLYQALLDTDITVDAAPSQFTVNTLRFSAASKTLTLNSAGPSTVTSGGILVTSAATGSVINSGGVGAALTSGTTGKEIVVHNYGGLTINANITDGNTTGVALTLGGTGTTVLNGTNTYTGATRVTSGITSLTGSVTNTAITAYTAGTLTQSNTGAIGGTSSLIVSGGTVTLGGTNTYSGVTTVQSGRLNINSVGALGSGNFQTAGTIDATNGAIASQTNNPNIILGGFTYGGTNSLNLGTGNVTTAGDTTITLAGNNSNNITFGGTFTNTGAAARTLTVNNATGVSGESVVFNNGFNLATGGSAIQYVFAGTGNVVINGQVANGTGSSNIGIIKNNAGALTLAGTNSFTGAVNWNGGTLNINNAAAISGSTLVINGGTGGVLNNTSGAAITTSTFNPAITWTSSFGFGGSDSLYMGTGQVNISSDRVVTLLGNNSNTLTFGGLLQGTQTSGAFTLTVNNGVGVSGETLVFNNGFNMQAAAGVGGGNFILSGNGRLTINGAIANGSATANNLTYNGTGTLTLGGISTYNGTTSISGNGGTVQLNGTLGSTAGTAITVSNSATLNQAAGGAIVGTSSITNNTNAITTLAGTNSYSGTTTLNSGRINVNSNSALGSGNVTLAGGTVDNTGLTAVTGQTNNPVIVLTGSFAFGGTNNLNLGTGQVNNGGDRTITLNGNNTTLTFGGVLNNTNAAAGFNITVNNGVGFSGSSVVFNNGYNIAAAADTGSRIGILGGNGKIVVNGAVANGNGLAQSLTYAGTTGGSLTLAGTNSYTGATLVTGGTLLLNGSTDAASTVTVNSGAAIGGTGTTNGVLNANGTITPGSAGTGTPGMLTAANGASIGNNSTLAFDLDNANVAGGTGGNDLFNVIGNLNVGANAVLTVTPGANFSSGTYQLIDYSGTLNITGAPDLSGWTLTGVSAEYDYVFGYGGSDNGVNSIFVTVAVPEPASIGLLALGATGLLRRRRRTNV